MREDGGNRVRACTPEVPTPPVGCPNHCPNRVAITVDHCEPNEIKTRE